MKMRQRRKQFWWTFHMEDTPPYPESPRYGVGCGQDQKGKNMTDITDKLRQLYVQSGTSYVQQAADEIERLRDQLESEYDRGYQAAMQRQAVEVDALIAQWPRAKPKGKK